MYAIVSEFNNLVIDITEEREEYGPSPYGFGFETIEVPEGVTVELGYEYDRETGIFAPEDRSNLPPIEPPEPEITDSEKLDALVINTELLVAMNEVEGI